MKIINHVIWSLRDLLSLYIWTESHRKTFLFLLAWISNSLCREGKVPFLNSFQTYVQLTWVLRENLELEGGLVLTLLHQNLIQMLHKNKQVMHAKLQQLSWKLVLGKTGLNEISKSTEWDRLRGFNKGNFINLFSRNKVRVVSAKSSQFSGFVIAKTEKEVMMISLLYLLQVDNREIRNKKLSSVSFSKWYCTPALEQKRGLEDPFWQKDA